MSKGAKLAEAEPQAAQALVGQLEAALEDQLEQRGVARSDLRTRALRLGWRATDLLNVCARGSSSWEAAQEWALAVRFCRLHGQTLSSFYPAVCARHGRLLHFLLFVQLHDFPPQQVNTCTHTRTHACLPGRLLTWSWGVFSRSSR